MGILGYIKKCLTSHYATFTGRARRLEYWGFVLFSIIVSYGIMIFGGGMAFITRDVMMESDGMAFLLPFIGLLVINLLLIIPSLAVLVRRLHDINKSGWMALLAIVPLANLVLLIFLLFEGTRGSNQYGPDPKNPDNETIADQLV